MLYFQMTPCFTVLSDLHMVVSDFVAPANILGHVGVLFYILTFHLYMKLSQVVLQVILQHTQILQTSAKMVTMCDSLLDLLFSALHTSVYSL